MDENRKAEYLDYCRIKKIFEKGFGFLTSLYHSENIFFHFSKINDKEKKEALSALKRGVISIFFTSKLVNGKRRVDKVWLNIGDVPEYFLSNFINRLILELNGGRTNPFEIIEALNQLRVINKLSKKDYSDILSSQKIVKNPSILLKLFLEDEFDNLEKTNQLLNNFKKNNLTDNKFKKELLAMLNPKGKNGSQK